VTFGQPIAIPRPLTKHRPESQMAQLGQAIEHSKRTGEAVPVMGCTQGMILDRASRLGYRVTTRKLDNGTVLMWFKCEVER